MTYPDTFSLALLQHSPTPESLGVSVARIQKYAAIASRDNADLLIVPEASLTGYNISLASARQIAVPKHGAVSDRLRDICLHEGIALAYGYIERDGDELFNSAHVIDKSGATAGHYRKTHLWGELDRTLFKPGPELSPVFSIAGWQIGLLICYDIEFPETVRHLTLAGAELVLTPTALMHPWSFVAEHVIRVRAAESQVFVAYANYCGSENDIDYAGRSCIVGPDGNALCRAGIMPELLCAQLHRTAMQDIRNRLPYLHDRRPGLYELD